jgi:hypothetical protein
VVERELLDMSGPDSVVREWVGDESDFGDETDAESSRSAVEIGETVGVSVTVELSDPRSGALMAGTEESRVLSSDDPDMMVTPPTATSDAGRGTAYRVGRRSLP